MDVTPDACGGYIQTCDIFPLLSISGNKLYVACLGFHWNVLNSM
jgi:hypothetical protein